MAKTHYGSRRVTACGLKDSRRTTYEKRDVTCSACFRTYTYRTDAYRGKREEDMSESKYKAGQRVRIEWPSGSAVEGALSKERYGARLSVIVPRAGGETTLWQPDAEVGDGRVVTVLSTPKMKEPTVNGVTVVGSRRQAVAYGVLPSLVHFTRQRGGWYCIEHARWEKWGNIIDPRPFEYDWDKDEEIPPTPAKQRGSKKYAHGEAEQCSNCGMTDSDCLAKIKERNAACCSTCYESVTHNQDALVE